MHSSARARGRTRSWSATITLACVASLDRHDPWLSIRRPDMAEPRLSYLIGRLERLVRRRLATALEPAGLTLPAYTTLSVLKAQNGLSNAQLARRSLVTPQSMSEVLAFL